LTNATSLTIHGTEKGELQAAANAVAIQEGGTMRNLKWYYLLGIAIGLIALGAIIYWIVRTGDLLSRLNIKKPKEIETEN
jgi:hypothetical protein